MPLLTPQEEQSLVAGLQEGSRESFRFFYDRYFIPLFYFARGYVTDQQAAEDIATEAFIRLWKKHPDFETAVRIKNFLFLAARNLSVDFLRRKKSRQHRDEAFTSLVAEPTEETLAREEITGALFQCIYEEAEKLPEQLGQVFRLAYIKGLSNEEISNRMGISDQTVRNYKTSALKTIRNALAGKDLFGLLLFICWYNRFMD